MSRRLVDEAVVGDTSRENVVITLFQIKYCLGNGIVHSVDYQEVKENTL